MVRRSAMSIQWVIVISLVGLLATGGCSKKNVSGTSTGAEGRSGPSKSKMAGGPKSDAGRPDSSGSGRSGVGSSELEPSPGDLRAGGGPRSDALGKRGDSSGGTDLPSSDQSAKSDAGSKSPSGLKRDGAGDLDSPGRSTESLGPIGSGPLQGFSKAPGDERLGESSPLMIAKAAPDDAESRKSREDRRRELADIYFAFDKWALSSEGKKNLSESASFLKQNPAAKLVIEGYCDERGSREYNLVLGEKRAKETRKYLADLGIQNPVSVTSYGKERQVCAERDEACYWKNRRAHLVIEEAK
jgi:peptidoglycan-associated lipoprotein